MIVRRPLSLTTRTTDFGDPYVEIPTRWRTLVRPGRILPVRASSVNPTPGTITRSIQPFKIAGSPLHQVGYEDQRIDTADQVGGCLYERIEDWFIALVRLPLGFAHRRPEPLGVEVNDIDAVSGNLEAGDGTLGEGVGVAVSTGVRERRRHARCHCC